jgi:hypothetical protein
MAARGCRTPREAEHREAGDDESKADTGDEASLSSGHRQAVDGRSDRGRGINLVPGELRCTTVGGRQL